ncbi:hypothetical protein C7B65_12940 [Phormidesmis priestleyi ULC007]|uniref:Uncharacterized protein n=1 Tax=Phormidesmis priestleyi ULC007 TaxID=1920490 RepID=A0A2T1DFE0_9CYAN|nr:hypothetical protein [Phormidesmis priestleyi]PSB19175.1 hypothetical protein C7B65_12940 [Phormidesmis priestleyi ULC007]PZO50027.1 MAG: hypothetical protein DCF14_12885 [Phormidesmis priestleyi]
MPTIDALKDFADQFKRVSEAATKLDENANVVTFLVNNRNLVKFVLDGGAKTVDDLATLLRRPGMTQDLLVNLLTKESLTISEIRSTIVKGVPAETHELPEAIRFGALEGGGEFEFFGNSQGVEGVFRPTNKQGVETPVSLKSFHDVSSLGSLPREIRRNSNQAQAVGIENAIFYGEPIQFNTNQLADFATNGPIYQQIVQDGAFSKIILKGSDGIVEITRSGVRIIK